ncbi:MAG TPA: carboxylate--amine ligase [Anaerolineae bacterium]
MNSDFPNARQPYAIVIGLDGMNGLQTARLLAQRKVPVIGIARDQAHYGCRTNSCKKILFADTKSDEFIKTLEMLGPQLNQKAVLFPCEDMAVLLVSRHRQTLQQWYHVVLPAADVIELMIDKVAFYEHAQREDLPIPRTFYIHSRAELEQAVDGLTFPCILKPPTSATKKWELNSKLKAYKLTNADELFAAYERCQSWADMLLLQEWVEGPESNLYSCNCYFDAHSEPLVTFVARKLRQWPPLIGESSLGEECRDDIVLNETVRLFRSIRHYGLGYLEMKRDERTGKYFIIEPNIGRPTGRSAIAEAGGVELVYTMYCDALGWPLPANREQKYRGVKWIYLRRDLQSALHHWRRGNLTFKSWWQSMRGHKTDAVFSWTDPAPFYFDLVRAVRLYMIPDERRKRNYRDL